MTATITRHSVKSPGVYRLGFSLTKADIMALDRARTEFDAPAPVSRALAVSTAIHLLATMIDHGLIRPRPIGHVQLRHGDTGRPRRGAGGIDLRIDFAALAGVIRSQQEHRQHAAA